MMKLTRITAASSLFVLTGIAALGMASLAAQTPAPPGDRPATAKENEKEKEKEAPSPKPAEKREGAPRELSVDAFPPVVVKTVPEPGSTGVDPSLVEIRVKFNKPMRDGSWSWVQSGRDTFPETNGKVHYDPDQQTCVMPVKLKAGKTYVIWINAQRFQSFCDAAGNPAVPYLLVFQTREP